MKYQIDHDYHIHSQLSACSGHPEQTGENILQYAKKNGLKKLVLTDHYWDSAVPGVSDWYRPQNFDHIAKSLPLPQAEGIEFLFGAETDMNYEMTVGLPKERFDDFAFFIVPTTHLHMDGFTFLPKEGDQVAYRAALWVERLEKLLCQDLPFRKIGIAHLACELIYPRSRENYLRTLDRIPQEDMERLFTKAAALGCGIELNQSDMGFADDEADRVLRMFRIAKRCGCKFYLGSDSHDPEWFLRTEEIFRRAVDLLELEESDKFHIGE